ncbi:MAG: hypothetical protein ABW252_21030 [Polyangiales bacterium]
MLNQPLIERAIAWAEAEQRVSDLATARRRFESATGPIDEHARDYEARITHFLEHFFCEEGAHALVAFAHAAELTIDARRELAGWLRSHRSVFAFTGFDGALGHLRDCVFGGDFRFFPSESDRRLTVGDRFDSRLVPVGELLYLAAGRVYHPRETHDALDTLLPQLDLDSLPATELLDGLLLMRSRYLSFASVRAEHVYQARALAPVRLPLRQTTE